jgi:PilZ domain
MLDRRKAQRGRTYIGSRVAFDNRYATLDCLVRNLSDHGAKIVFACPATIPNELDVMIHPKDDNRRARVIWRTESEAGVMFLPAKASKSASPAWRPL